jgi:N-acetylglucosamine-6-phosphate deacetylase
MSRVLLLYNAIVHAPEGRIEPGWVLVVGGRVSQLGSGAPPAFTGAEGINLMGQNLAPGLIDLHVHGALGYDTMDSSLQALRHMALFYAQHGVTGFLATTISNPSEPILRALQNIAVAMDTGTGGAALLGAHVEGPYLDVERRGCQDPTQVRQADAAEYERFFATGVVKLITLAPEVPGNEALIRYAVAHGVAVAAGHSRASYEQMCYAVELGLSQVTHLFNGMEPLHHRQPGVVGAGLGLDALYCQLIADNIHIHPAVLKLAVRAKGLDRILLITDAMSGTGMPDGDYDLGGLVVTVNKGVARVASGALAGSTLTLERGLRHIMDATGLALGEALPMATRNPAQALGLERRKGSIALGQDADLVVLDESLNVSMTIVAGEIVHNAGSAEQAASGR